MAKLESPKAILRMVLYAVAIAMGIATLVLMNVEGGYSPETFFTIFGIAIICMALAGMAGIKDE